MIVMENVPLTVACAASVILTLMLLKVPVVVGVPLIVMVVYPVCAAVRPAGNPLTVRLCRPRAPVTFF